MEFQCILYLFKTKNVAFYGETTIFFECQVHVLGMLYKTIVKV